MSRKILIFTVFVTTIVYLLTGCDQSGSEDKQPENSDAVAIQPFNTPTPTGTATPVPTDTTAPTETTEPIPTPTATPDIDLAIELPEGEPLRGRNAAVRYRCHGCHVKSADSYGPPFTSTDDLPHIMERGEVRIADPAYEGRATTNLEYIIESIFLTNVYKIPGDWEEEMPTTFPLRITDEELANIIAWMRTLESE